MCGIAGILSLERPVDAGLVSAVLRMMDSEIHRGPDDWGLLLPDRAYQDPELRCLLASFDPAHIRTYPSPSAGPAAVLGFRRLAILDLTPRGRQPMSNRDGTVWITYNGEVYNYRDLRLDLEQIGYTFQSDTDTEVILQGYQEWGKDVLTRLRGMFAFGIVDLRAPRNTSGSGPRFFAARDRFGMKPFYYAETPVGLLFASELKGLMASELLPMEPHPEALPLFLAWGSIPAPNTFYRAVHSLPIGYWLELTRWGLSSRRYWNLADCYASERRRHVSPNQVIEETRAALVDSVKAHLVSDVPVGAFLSGGIDSSAVVALMREAGQSRIKTVSVVFPDTEYDESRYARLVAERFETEHVEVPVTSRDLLNQWDRIFAAMDQPTVDGVNTYFVAKATHEAGLKVALSGLGGDELFRGYPSFRDIPRLHRVSKWLGPSRLARRAILAPLALCYPQQRAKFGQLLGGPNSLENVYLSYRGMFMPEELERLLSHPAEPLDNFCAHLPETNGVESSWDRVSILETDGYMANQLLRDTDAFSMTHSLETRVPFVDHRLLESVATLPRELWIKGRPKALLIDALRGCLPDVVLHRPKMGFTFPFRQWLQGEARQKVESFLQRGNSFPKAAVADLWDRFLVGRAHWSRVWALVVWNVYSSVDL